jgi:hypothetical protein
MDEAGETVAVSNEQWQCLVIHSAPLDKSCEGASNPTAGEGACTFEASEEPNGWDTASFDASNWPEADVYSEREVGPKDGYDKINWIDGTELIWGPDLEQSNTVLCRLLVE